MPVSQRSSIFICLIVLTLQQLVTGLICYQCSLCSTVNNNTGTITFPDNAGYSCYKTVGTLATVSIVNRGGIVNCQAGGGGISVAGGSNSCCTTDLCNSGIALSSSLGLAFVMVAICMVLHATINH